MKTMTITEARKNLGRLLDAAAQGQVQIGRTPFIIVEVDVP